MFSLPLSRIRHPRPWLFPRLPIRQWVLSAPKRLRYYVMIDSVAVPVFNAAKTIAACFKFRNKIGLDVAPEALRARQSHRQLDAVAA
jgi:hypothetical protein